MFFLVEKHMHPGAKLNFQSYKFTGRKFTVMGMRMKYYFHNTRFEGVGREASLAICGEILDDLGLGSSGLCHGFWEALSTGQRREASQ
jgi:hypothetical protein